MRITYLERSVTRFTPSVTTFLCPVTKVYPSVTKFWASVTKVYPPVTYFLPSVTRFYPPVTVTGHQILVTDRIKMATRMPHRALPPL